MEANEIIEAEFRYAEGGFHWIVITLTALAFSLVPIFVFSFTTKGTQNTESSYSSGILVFFIGLIFVISMIRYRHGRIVTLAHRVLVDKSAGKEQYLQIDQIFSIYKTSYGGSEFGHFRYAISHKTGTFYLLGNAEGTRLAEELARQCDLVII